MTLVKNMMPGFMRPQQPLQRPVPNNQQTGYGNNLPVNSIQKLVDKQPVTQGARYTLGAGANPFTITLVVPGQLLLGISVNTAVIADISDTFLTMNINGFNSLQEVNLLQLCPLSVQGIIFFPLQLGLVGNDTFKLSFQKNNAGNIVIGFNVNYLAQ